MTAVTPPETRLDAAVGALSRGLAERLTRRSAVARVGRLSVALSLGAAGEMLMSDEALAAGCCGACKSCSCCCNFSVWCGQGGYCPSGTCECGGWTYNETCTSGGRSGVYWYGDCCGQCGGGADCSCSGGAPSCCNYHEWNNGSCAQNDCTCGSAGWFIKCRRKYCNTG